MCLFILKKVWHLSQFTKVHISHNKQSAHPELPAAAVKDKLLDEPLVTRVSDLGFLATVTGDWFSALRFFTAQMQTTSALYSTYSIIKLHIAGNTENKK